MTRSHAERATHLDETLFYACAAKTGQERKVVEDIEAIGAWAWISEEITHKRFPGCSEPQVSRKPSWPGYVFANLDGNQFCAARSIENLHQTKLQLCKNEAMMLIRDVGRIEERNARVMRQIEAGQIVMDYSPGDSLEILNGAFADRLASLSSIVKRNGQYILSLNVDGSAFPVQVDPADVRRLA